MISIGFFPTFAAFAPSRELLRVLVAALPRWDLCKFLLPLGRIPKFF